MTTSKPEIRSDEPTWQSPFIVFTCGCVGLTWGQPGVLHPNDYDMTIVIKPCDLDSRDGPETGIYFSRREILRTKITSGRRCTAEEHDKICAQMATVCDMADNAYKQVIHQITIERCAKHLREIE